MVLEKIRSLLSEQLDIDIDEISAQTKIIEDLGADSLDVVEMMMDLEEEYGISAEEDDLKGLVTVADVAAFIEARL